MPDDIVILPIHIAAAKRAYSEPWHMEKEREAYAKALAFAGVKICRLAEYEAEIYIGAEPPDELVATALEDFGSKVFNGDWLKKEE